MPDNQFSHCQERTSELEHFISGASEYTMRTRATFVKEEKISSAIGTLNHLSASPDAKGCQADRGFNTDICDAMFQSGQSPKKSRAKESSKHFGVRFRPDLQKWVAEIRVAEWKTVDKKVWLGTFDSEEGAARAVDAARKLLKCKKKRPHNFPCESLTAYSEKMPTNLNLNNLGDDSMFKEVTLFVKRKAQEYAASFCPNKTHCISISADQILAKCNSVQEPSQEFAFQEDNISMASYGTSYGSYKSYNIQPGVMDGDDQWMSPTAVTTYCSTSTSVGTSPDDQKTCFYVNNSCYNYRQADITHIEEQLVEGDWMAVNRQSASSFRDVDSRGTIWEGQNMASDGQHNVLPDNEQWLTEVNDFLFPNDDEYFENQSAKDIVPRDEMLYVESQNQPYSIGDPSLFDCVQQQNPKSYHSLLSSMDYTTQVC